MFVCMYVCKYVCVYGSKYVRMCVSIFVWMYVCVHIIYRYVCIFVCMHVIYVIFGENSPGERRRNILKANNVAYLVEQLPGKREVPGLIPGWVVVATYSSLQLLLSFFFLFQNLYICIYVHV